jgi:DNA mismatch endonuclease (patch repair protein)
MSNRSLFPRVPPVTVPRGAVILRAVTSDHPHARRGSAVLTDAARSRQMALIRHKDTKPELLVRRFLHAAGLRYRLHDTRLPGRPDLVFAGRRVAVFVHGCFWHQHPGCRAARLPKSRADFWLPKLAGNVSRDARTEAALRAAGWDVIIVWECETRSRPSLDDLLARIRARPRVASAAVPPRRRSIAPPASPG